MTAFLKYARDILLVGLLATLIFFVVVLTRAVQQISRDVSVTATSLQKTSDQLAETSKSLQEHANRVLTEAGLTAMEARKASTEQRAFWNKEVPVLAAKAEATFDQTNVLLANLGVLTKNMDGETAEIATQLVATNVQLQKDLQTFNTSLQTVNERLSSEQLTETLGNINQTTASLAKTAESTSKAAADIQAKVHSLTTPDPTLKGRVLSVLKTIFALASNGAQLAYYLRY